MRTIIEDAYRDVIKNILDTIDNKTFENLYKIIYKVVKQCPLQYRQHLLNLFYKNNTFDFFPVIRFYKSFWENNIYQRLPDDYLWFVKSYLKQELHGEFPEEFRQYIGKHAVFTWYNGGSNRKAGGFILYMDERFVVFWNYFKARGTIIDKIDGWYKKLNIKVIDK